MPKRSGNRDASQISAVRDAESLIHLARVSMATRERDLAVFQFANPRDAFLVDDGEGLAFAFVGMQAERRALLPAIYGGLTLQNGVPIGYVQLDILGRHAELSFNQFETFRHGGAARVFARFVAATHHVFGCDSFSIEPYQLGDGNDEGIESGAWWFYRHFGFQPRAKSARDALAPRERAPGAASRASKFAARAARACPLVPFLFARARATARMPRINALLAAANRCDASIHAARSCGPQRSRDFGGTQMASRRADCVRRRNACSRSGRGSCSRLHATGRWSVRDRRALLSVIRAKAGASERAYLKLVLATFPPSPRTRLLSPIAAP